MTVEHIEKSHSHRACKTALPAAYKQCRQNNNKIAEEKGEETIEVNYIDLEKEVHPNAEKAIASINDLLYNKGLYNHLKEEKFIEKLGEYYMDDLTGETGTAEVNKTKKRVITYTFKD